MPTKILNASSLVVLAFWLVSLGYLVGECYSTGYDRPIWEWHYLGVDHWKALNTMESCMSWDVHKIAGEDGVRVWWNMPVLGILLWWLGSLISMSPYRRYADDDVAAVREKAR